MSTSDPRVQAAIAERAAEWFVTNRSGNLSDAQRSAFIDWLRESPAHAREYLALTGFSEDLKEVAGGCQESVAELVAQANRDDSVVHPLFVTAAGASSKPVPGSNKTWLAWVATAATVLIGVLAVTFYQPRDFATAHAEQRSLRMPDGSSVHLNSSSRIRIDFDEQERRVSLLQGQAVFQVAKDPRRPFWVSAGDTLVRAVGTEFDVYRKPEGTVVSVMEGRVAVWRGEQASATQLPVANLDAGQQLRIESGSPVVSEQPKDVRKAVAWLQRQIVFDHDELGQAVAEFNRYNDVRIRVDDAALRTVEVSGNFNAYDSESFIRFLERQPGMHVQRDGQSVIVSAVPSP